MADSQNQGINDPNEIIEDGKFQEKTVDEIRQQVIEDFGFEDNDPRVEKLLNKTLETQKALSTAIKQKIRYREQLNSSSNGKAPASQAGDDIQSLRKELEDIKLGQVGNYSSEIKEDIKKYAQLNGVSFHEAAQSDYVQFKIEKEKTTIRNDNASLGQKPVANYGGKKNWSSFDGDLSSLSEEEYDDYKAFRKGK